MIKQVFDLNTVDSTNDYLLRLINSGQCHEGTLVVAKEQTAGKGLAGNKWESEPGKNLTFSFYMVPDFLEPARQFDLNKAISLAVCDYVRQKLPGENVRVKWPNDIYTGNRKVAGILIQTAIRGDRFEYVITGIGINVNQQVFLSDAPNPVSLIHYLKKELDLAPELSQVIRFLNGRLDMLRESSSDQLDRDYLFALYRYDQYAEYVYQGTPVVARIKGVNNFGQLILITADKKKLVCGLKEVEFVI